MVTQRGFTLIEIIIGIVVIAIVTLVVTAGMGPLFRQSVDPWQQVRGAELGQSLMNEIMARKFDDANTASYRCSASGPEQCTNPPNPTSASCPAVGNSLPHIENSETRDEFDDVDDFNCVGITTNQLNNIFGDGIDVDYYRGFSAEIRVYSVADDQLKQIDIDVVTPQGERIEFSSLRGNW
ncbi:pili assembly chaperone [Idiomarina sp. OT37-5b]|uniref:prepilin-type N-terminal cleavage/methylation domain-containing protein n=1 Tax=Idiomarina sp. OT37-5b TaxID=2100422 RepID=UPI000CF8AFE4|nr:prepilin-type N-terminal cleavage/methylation domain-containing protein [Idiomarina sp. OT37-5b]AVJ55073.1 pili assembly chaperone [Idiomarina sp. OT37-5b]